MYFPSRNLDCNTYNADYDGDEMNCHFPQSYLGRSEAEYIAKTDLQFIVPTDGSPLRGLIQDHVVAGVKLTKRDTFLEKWEYQQLLFAALASLPRLELIRSDARIELLPPAIIKPKKLWYTCLKVAFCPRGSIMVAQQTFAPKAATSKFSCRKKLRSLQIITW